MLHPIEIVADDPAVGRKHLVQSFALSCLTLWNFGPTPTTNSGALKKQQNLRIVHTRGKPQDMGLFLYGDCSTRDVPKAGSSRKIRIG
jgi:hypothetical protein